LEFDAPAPYMHIIRRRLELRRWRNCPAYPHFGFYQGSEEEQVGTQVILESM
jgi:hypothetical protein